MKETHRLVTELTTGERPSGPAVDVRAGQRFGAAVRALRRSASLTQEELAESAGISARTVSDVERGLRVTVHGDTARRLATALRLAGAHRQEFEALARGEAAPEPPEQEASGLPAMPTPLLGRSSELTAITTALLTPGTRLLTLTGPGGIGKTRLAIEAARRVRQYFGGGVFFVSLGEVKDASLVAPEVAKALGVPESRADLQGLLVRRLAAERALVVLDTLEHLTAAAPLVYAMMLGSEQAVFLLTSRSALRLRGEHQFPVPPLDLPAERDALTLADLSRWPATELFWKRALAARPGLAGDRSAATHVAEICRRLDGLPLAIELAAARVKHLPLPAIAAQLDDRLKLLTGGSLDLPRRQRTIRDTVAWSHDLLEPEQARFFRRLAVFRGGWDLPSAEAVCAGSGDAGDVLDAISALVDQSLVVLDPDHPQARYRMLDTIRDFAAHRLSQAGEADQAGSLHARNFLHLAEEAEPNLVRAGHDDWFRRLDLERANLRRAIEWLTGHGETVLAHRFTAALWRYWRQRGDFTEGRGWIEAVLAMPGDVPPGLRSRTVGAAAALAYPQGDFTRLAELAREATDLAQRGDDPIELRNALTLHGFVAVGQGRHREALEIFDRCVDLCRPGGDSWQLGTSHLNRGIALLNLDRPGDADTDFVEGLGVYRRLGDEIFAARIVNLRAQAALALGDIDRADDLGRDALTAFARHGELQGIASALGTLAAAAAARNEPDRAASLAGTEAAISQSLASSDLPDRVLTARLLAGAERTADAARWQAAWEAGRLMAVEAAVEYALAVG
ncbi:MAG TPA: helix-turn-helix domain-containing protein [Streptosporangiaceae bacterium]